VNLPIERTVCRGRRFPAAGHGTGPRYAWCNVRHRPG